ncbi:codanin-1 [Pectinophora gossypiella]|uniref:codanin-1 n=1 Tax=Pectinophora gossypiella TaxID=13191 RepID=UPI00214EEF21|nr:codanin-1 [Pectinophora gossypiella]
MPETIIASVLSGELEARQLRAWLRGATAEGVAEARALHGCSRNEFVLYFLSYLRNQTDSIVQQCGGAVPAAPQSPVVAGRPHRRSVSDPTHSAPEPHPGDPRACLAVAADPRPHDSPARDKKRATRKVKTKLFPDDRSRESIQSVSSDESRLNSGIDRLNLSSSTPLKNGLKMEAGSAPMSPITPVSRSHERCDTPRAHPRHARSHDKTLGDYLTSAQKTSKKKKSSSKNVSEESEGKMELDISSSDAFPDLSVGARKSSSLRSEKRRIKPTNIDLSKKSLSLNSFNSEQFQQPSPLALEENAAFKPPKLQPKELASSYDAERNMLRQERSRLMEKFSTMSAATSPKCSTPLIKITQNSFDKAATYVTADASKITFKDKLDLLVELYDTMLTYNLIFCYNTELFFLISILQSKQNEDDYVDVESKLTEENMASYLLRSIHNCVYFAVRALWCQRNVLEVILDKQSLKLLGEVKSVRAIGPELAKCMLNAYGVRCEGEKEGAGGCPAGDGGGVVVFNLETDNADNFPSTASFQSFKKQRDMFYEIVRWYQEWGGAGPGASLRSRVRALLGAGSGATLPHLARLWARHLAAGGGGGSRLGKLHRRLTRPPQQGGALFTTDEEFYREFLVVSESEAFRAHVRDALLTELLAIDKQHHLKEGVVPQGGAWWWSARLGKLLGALAALPYEGARGAGERLLRTSLALRTYSQPPFDLLGILESAYQESRLIITVPWTCHYLSTLDPVALRLPYYQRVLKMLAAIYRGLAPRGDTLGASVGNECGDADSVTRLYLKSTLAWLFAAPHVPQETLYEDSTTPLPARTAAPPSPHVLSEAALEVLLPARRTLHELLAGGSAGAPQARHVTPLRVGAVTKHHEIQARLEAALVSGAAGAARRVLELAAERVAARAQRRLARALQPHRGARCGPDTGCGPADVAAVGEVGRQARAWLRAALGALLAGGAGAGALCGLAERNVRARLARAALDAAAPGALCPAAAAELQALLAGPWSSGDDPPPAAPAPPAVPVVYSVAESIIELKEQVCQLLWPPQEPGPAPPPSGALAACARACAACSPACRAPARRAVLQLTLDLCVLTACKRPADLTEEFLDAVEAVWVACCGSAPPRPASPAGSRAAGGAGCEAVDSRAPTPDSDGEPAPPGNIVIAAATSGAHVAAPPADKGTADEDEVWSMFGRVVCARNITLVARCGVGSASWRALAALLGSLLRRGWLHEHVLSEQCVALYRHEWPQEVLSPLSTCLHSLSTRAGSLHMLVGFLADYCSDLMH